VDLCNGLNAERKEINIIITEMKILKIKNGQIKMLLFLDLKEKDLED
jgi:hypothetical protein